MIFTYFIVKVLYILNLVIQFYMLIQIIGQGYTLYGIDTLRHMTNPEYTSSSIMFPPNTLCSFYIREFGGNTHRYTVQCVLPMNIFNEKIYVFLWFWLAFIGIYSIWSLVRWSWEIGTVTRIKFLKKYLKMSPDIEFAKTREEKRCLKEFANSYLRVDGVFLLRLMGRNISEVMLSEIICDIYDLYKREYYHPKDDVESSDEDNKHNHEKLFIEKNNIQDF